MNDRVLADLAGDGGPPSRGDRGGTRAALPLDIPRSASHDELWDRDTAGRTATREPEAPAPAEPSSEVAPEPPSTSSPDVVSEALAAYAQPADPPPAEAFDPRPVAAAAATVAPHDDEGPGRLVRPYAMTGGRTRSAGVEFALEALVIMTEQGRQRVGALTWEQRAIAELCSSPLSVAEISAHLKVPLGVARVLIGDMAADGLIELSGATANEQAPNDLNLLERVLNGLRAL